MSTVLISFYQPARDNAVDFLKVVVDQTSHGHVIITSASTPTGQSIVQH